MNSSESGAKEAERLRRRRMLLGLGCGIGSAVAYTVTNVLLRDVAERGDLGWTCWVTCLKAGPSAAVAWLLIGHCRWNGRRGMAGWRAYVQLTLAGLLMQLGGNVAFQYALSLGGLALTVPLCFSTLILAGALGGQLFLREDIPRRTQLAMSLLIVAVFILGQGADAAAGALHVNRSAGTVLAAILAAGVSGVSFGLGGVAMRHSVAGSGSLASTIAPIATAGVVVPAMIALERLGPAGIAAIGWENQAAMLTAGAFNAVGFFAVVAAMARLPLVRVNLINASQAALCAVAGIVCFDEPASLWVVGGTALTIFSLAILGTQDKTLPQDTVLVIDAKQPPLLHGEAAACESASNGNLHNGTGRSQSSQPRERQAEVLRR